MVAADSGVAAQKKDEEVAPEQEGAQEEQFHDAVESWSLGAPDPPLVPPPPVARRSGVRLPARQVLRPKADPGGFTGAAGAGVGIGGRPPAAQRRRRECAGGA
eukprot:COSAG01_NODE_4868_length_4666_cov_9.157434_4_plen_102_part_01